MALALSATIVSCDDFLEQEPPSYLPTDGFVNTESNLQTAVNQLYQDILPGHANWSYGIYGNDKNTDNQVDWWPDRKFGDGLWKTAQSGDTIKWNRIRNVNYWLRQATAAYSQKQISGDDNSIRQYIGELYFFRAYEYFEQLKKFGDFPIITSTLPNEESALVNAYKRRPCNEVARFILSDLDSATTFMKPDFEKRHTRVSYDVAKLLKSRVALYEGSWLTNFKGTPFVPGEQGWPGAKKDYNANFKFEAGSLDAEAKYFFQQAADAAEEVAEKYKGQLSVNNGIVPQKDGEDNPYLDIWGTDDMSDKPEVLLWRQYSKSLGIYNNVEVSVQFGNNGVGLTRSCVEGYLMKDGKPRYSSSYKYNDSTIANVAKNRDPRLTVFLKVPGQKNVFKNMSATEDHFVETEPVPSILGHNTEKNYSTGYAMRKGGTFDKAECGNGTCYNAAEIFRATEALLNYMEAEYMLTGSLNSGHIVEYWKDVRKAAGFTGDAVNPQVTIDATDMSKEKLDWGAWTAGKLLEDKDKVLYNIRRERRSELLGEGLREMDLKRWRSYDQLIKTPFFNEGIHFWNTPMEKWYDASKVIADGSGNATVSKKSDSEYLRPQQTNLNNNSYANGLTWHMAHYLYPMPLKQMQLTAPDHATLEDSPIYQNPYWPITSDSPAEQ